jgi:hypothetical protein
MSSRRQDIKITNTFGYNLLISQAKKQATPSIPGSQSEGKRIK